MIEREEGQDWAYYEQCWRLMLANLLQYNAERIEERVKVLLEIPTDFLTRERPQYHIAWDMLPESFRASKLHSELDAIASKVDRTIARFGTDFSDFSSADWHKVRQSINRVLSVHGLKLPEPASPRQRHRH